MFCVLVASYYRVCMVVQSFWTTWALLPFTLTHLIHEYHVDIP